MSEYNLLVVATDPDGRSSNPAEVVIKISDKNDNGPMIEASADKLLIVKGQIRYPVVFSVSFFILIDNCFVKFLNGLDSLLSKEQ